MVEIRDDKDVLLCTVDMVILQSAAVNGTVALAGTGCCGAELLVLKMGLTIRKSD